MNETLWMTLAYLGLGTIWLAVIVRVILRPHREPASRAAWIMLIIGLPVIGVLAYIFLGETNIGRSRVARAKEVLENLPPMVSQTAENGTDLKAVFPQQFAPLFRLGEAITGLAPVGGNSGHLMADSNTAIDNIVADMDAASDHIHLMFYIWLADNNGLKVVEALKRAAARGVVCRAMADGLGSRAMIGSKHWQSMHNAGVKVAVALPIGNLILQPLRGRIDLRNHRKIVVIDDSITYCGSQNCADPEFRVKPKYAPWVDALIRFEGTDRTPEPTPVCGRLDEVRRREYPPPAGNANRDLRRGLPRPGNCYGPNAPQLRDARDVYHPDVCGPSQTGYHNTLLCPQ